jgi:hypothetical protein
MSDEQRNPYDDANAHFECVGRLYYAKHHRLRPGKDAPAGSGEDSMDPDNLRLFQDWIKHEAFHDAIARINVLEEENAQLRAEMAHYEGQTDDEEALSRG